MASEPAASGEGQNLTLPRPAANTFHDRHGRENEGPSMPVQQDGSVGEELKGETPHTGGLSLPQFFLKPSLLYALATVGASHKAYTFKEILGFLKKFIFENKSIIDQDNPRYINCGGTLLGKAFGIDRLSYTEVRSYVLRNIVSAKENTSVLIPLPTIPDSLSEPETEYSYQGYDTAVCASSDGLDSEGSGLSQESVGEEEEEIVEYEVVTEEESDKNENDSESDVESLVLILDVGDNPDLDEDFFADESDSSCSEYDPELKQDQWSCLSCNKKNKPFRRYCFKCWKLRKDWYPDPSKRRKKRKPRPKKDKKRSLLEGLKNMRNSEGDKNSGDHTNEDDLPSGLERTSSVVSTSTVTSFSSGISSIYGTSSTAGTSSQEFTSGSQSFGSQDSGFGSQEISSPLELCETRKRKLSESSEEPKNKLRKVSESKELSKNLPKVNLNRLYKSVYGQRWLQSEEGKKLLETISSDSEQEEDDDNRCSLCYVRPKNASIIHGRISHIAYCYPCAKRLHNSKAKCPICRRKIHMVTKNSYL